MANEFVPGRGKDSCRGCNGSTLFSVLDLGELPIANELWITQSEPKEVFPLHLRICEDCGLGQVEDVVTPSRLFRDYRYLSSISESFVEHARVFAMETSKRLKFEPNDWVLEIASNDGYLLRHFIDLGISVLGVEPAENVAKLAVKSSVPTIAEFFGEAVARTIVKERGYPRLIVANNVMAHVPDLQDFIKGLSVLTGKETAISIENPSLMNFLTEDQFDTIYHEHYSYLTANSVAKIVKPYGLTLTDVEQIPTHGGSNRYWLNYSSNGQSISGNVSHIIRQESDAGLYSLELWKAFATRVQLILREFHAWMSSSADHGQKVFGYGAAAKASTLLNASKIQGDWLGGIADNSPEKQGRFMPIEGIPIISPTQMLDSAPTDVVIFPWNIQQELVRAIKAGSGSDVRIWRAIPRLEQIG